MDVFSNTTSFTNNSSAVCLMSYFTQFSCGIPHLRRLVIEVLYCIFIKASGGRANWCVGVNRWYMRRRRAEIGIANGYHHITTVQEE